MRLILWIRATLVKCLGEFDDAGPSDVEQQCMEDPESCPDPEFCIKNPHLRRIKARSHVARKDELKNVFYTQKIIKVWRKGQKRKC